MPRLLVSVLLLAFLPLNLAYNDDLDCTSGDACSDVAVSGSGLLQTTNNMMQVRTEALLDAHTNQSIGQAVEAKTVNELSGSRRRRCREHEQGCSVFKKCCDGFSCQPGKQKCYTVPRQLEEPCSAGFGCDAGKNLSCHPGVHKCYHVPRQEGEPCSAGYGCADDLYCKAATHKCVKDVYDPCAQGFDHNAPGCGCFRPTCYSRLCTCALLPEIKTNCGFDFPCAPRVDITALRKYEFIHNRSLGDPRYYGLNCDDPDCATWGWMRYQNVNECAQKCDESKGCAAFTILTHQYAVPSCKFHASAADIRENRWPSADSWTDIYIKK